MASSGCLVANVVLECRLLSGLPSYSEASGAGAHRAPVMDVPAVIQLKFLQYYENVEVPQFPFRSSTECSNFQLCFTGVYAQCKLCKSWRNHRAVLRLFLRVHCCALTGAGDGPDSAETRGVRTGAVLGQGLHACNDRCWDGPDNAENREVSARVLGQGFLPVAVQDRGLSRQCRKP